jgi:hypothetical protein
MTDLFDVYKADGTLAQAGVDLETVAAAMELDAAEIEWAIEEEGRVETDELIAVPAGETI